MTNATQEGPKTVRVPLDETGDVNPLAGVIKCKAGAVSWSLDAEKFKVAPDAVTVEDGSDVFRCDVFTQGDKHRAGEIFYCPAMNEWFHLVPTGQKLVDGSEEIARQGKSKDRDTAVKSLFQATWPDYFKAEKRRVKV